MRTQLVLSSILMILGENWSGKSLKHTYFIIVVLTVWHELYELYEYIEIYFCRLVRMCAEPVGQATPGGSPVSIWKIVTQKDLEKGAISSKTGVFCYSENSLSKSGEERRPNSAIFSLWTGFKTIRIKSWSKGTHHLHFWYLICVLRHQNSAIWTFEWMNLKFKFQHGRHLFISLVTWSTCDWHPFLRSDWSRWEVVFTLSKVPF